MEIKVNNLTDEQLKEVSALVKKFENENEKPKKVIDYNNGFIINGTGVSRDNAYTRDGVDMFYSLGLYRDTKQECEKLIKKMQIEHRLREWSKMCEDKVDWLDYEQKKYCISCEIDCDYFSDNDGDEYKVSEREIIVIEVGLIGNDIYFTDKSILEKAIADIGKQKLTDEYFVEI